MNESLPKWVRILFNLIFWIGIGASLLFGAITASPEKDDYIVFVIFMSMLSGAFYTIEFANIIKILIYTFVINDNKKDEK